MPTAPSVPPAADAVLQRLEELLLGESRLLTGREVAAAAGVERDLARRLRRAMGLPDVPDGEPAFVSADVAALRSAAALLEEQQLEVADVVSLTRTLGLAVSRMADSVIGFGVEGLLSGQGQPGAAFLEQLSADHLEKLDGLVVYLLHRHLLDAAGRWLAQVQGGEEHLSLAVGFADLVDFTSLSQAMSETEVAAMVERFEVLAVDTVVGGDGRVVKMIGDEVMFSAEPAAAGEIALTLAEAFSEPDLPPVRVGLACGSVVARFGDLFGPVVNLAARLTAVAKPGTVLVSGSLVDLLALDERYVLRRIRAHRLKGIGLTELSVLRRAG
ncbi:MAG: adenylate/guanylate cyclase domain-containing protein [Acidimicrobiales bacterium]